MIAPESQSMLLAKNLLAKNLLAKNPLPFLRDIA